MCGVRLGVGMAVYWIHVYQNQYVVEWDVEFEMVNEALPLTGFAVPKDVDLKLANLYHPHHQS